MTVHDVDGLNAGYAQALLDEYLENPDAVPPAWRALFETGDPHLLAGHPGLARLLERLPRGGSDADGSGNGVPAPVAVAEAPPAPAVPAPAPAAPAREADLELLAGIAAAVTLVKAHRTHGHLGARLDPLGSEPVGDPSLEPLRLEPRLTPDLQARIPASVLRVHVPGDTLADVLPKLVETYCGTIAYELEHLSDHEQRMWLRRVIESGEYRTPLSRDEQRALFRRLCQVEGMERFLRKRFLGQKQFSLEGLDVMIPMIDETIELAAQDGAHEIVMGMAHRGRLNVLAHTIGVPYEQILREFEGERNLDAVAADPEGGTGDVKYHLGAHGARNTSGGSVGVRIVPNPSHLEAVDPVVEGRTRAVQTDRSTPHGAHDRSVALALLLHGDAAFAGQGVVAETFNLQSLTGYSTGGTLHLITNNQIGFTTDPSQGRSTRYSSDLAKGFDVPIVHVNADDPDACLSAVRLAVAYRELFHGDFLIDVVGYRRRGHNEEDEPAYTQPLMYERIKKHPPARKLYADQLAKEGIVPEREAAEMATKAYQALADAHQDLKAVLGAGPETGEYELDRSASSEPRTACAREMLDSLNDALVRVPQGFAMHRKLKPQIEKRQQAFAEGKGIDWAHAESLAFASLLVEGVPVRLTGQDSERGTFSQRHLVFHDSKTGERHTPLKHISAATAPFELHNSPLSEIAALGFEYGYSVQAPNALVLWEAQFGDFVNSAQVIIDQFIASGLAKWGQTSRLTMLLPHGYEGSGPEHSSGRLERFLQLCAEGNIRVANCTTPAQYFHLLRRQALVAKERPLVVMTPKSLLRLPAAQSTPDELADGRFHLVLDDPTLPGAREEVTRLCLCTGKVYYDLAGHDDRAESKHVAIARIELLYPFPEAQLQELFASYPNLKEVLWVQEEPKNMGSRAYMRPRLEEILPEGVIWDYVGREMRASPGEGYPVAHRREQERIVRVALGESALYRDRKFVGGAGSA